MGWVGENGLILIPTLDNLVTSTHWSCFTIKRPIQHIKNASH